MRRLGIALALAASVLACRSSAPAPSAPPDDGRGAAIDARIDALEQRIDTLEREREHAPVAAPTSAGWSCMAKCGERDHQTTEFHVTFRRITGHGESAAAAYQALIDACDGTLYERIEDESFVGGEMRSVCLPDAGDR